MQSEVSPLTNKTTARFASRWGFILSAAGSAVGMANVWGFPAKLGQNGGGAFLIAYLVFIVLFSLVGLSFPTANITPSRFHTSQRPPVLVTGSRFVILFQSGVKGVGGVSQSPLLQQIWQAKRVVTRQRKSGNEDRIFITVS